MKTLNRILSLLSCGALLLALTPNAHAASISGDLAMIGSDSFTFTAPYTITFYNPGTLSSAPGANTGVFAPLAGASVTMAPGLANGTAIPFSTGFNVISPFDLFSVGGFSFYLTDYTAVFNYGGVGCTNATCLAISGDGYFTGAGYTDTPGTFALTTQETGDQTSTTFSASAASAPEPESLALVGSGLIGLAGFARRKFFSAQA
jgi:hypothetical protein